MWKHFFKSLGHEFFSSKILLRKKIKNFIYPKDDLFFEPVFSGRSGIFMLAEKLSLNPDINKTALIPDYICDVVPKALERAGFKVFHFRLDNDFLPEMLDLEEMLKFHKPGILLITPIYGNDGGLSKLKKLNLSETSLFLDACQDIDQIKKYNKLNVKNYYIIGSFNMKQIPGIMGGFILSEEKISSMNFEKLKLKDRFQLRVLCFFEFVLKPLVKVLRKNKDDFTKAKFTFSECKSFPYGFIHYFPCKMQLALAYNGLKTRKKFKINQSNFLNTNNIKNVNSNKYAPFIVSGQEIKSRTRKLPYSINGDPKRSRRPELLVYHNKGFLDE